MPRFETIGNATIIVYEGNKNNYPLLATDIWLDEYDAYFGSWRLTHKVPEKQRESLEKVKYIFISHFHPDHLHLKSLQKLKNSTIILAQHYGSRVEKDLRKAGFKVMNLPSRKWISIGEKTRIILFNNEIHDSSILIELEDNRGTKSLLVNLNDSGGKGNIKEIAEIAYKYKNSFYLQLHSYGDADMINLFDKKGKRIEPIAAQKNPVGADIANGMKKFNCNIAIPFSCHHQYQRRDSFWANKYTTPLPDFLIGFKENKDQILLPAFQNVVLIDGVFQSNNINPEKIEIIKPIPESKFGDDWSVPLSTRDINECKNYFLAIKTLIKNYKNISLIVGKQKTSMFENGKGKASLIFEVPRSSLMKSIRQEIFDDLLIGNYMKTTIIDGINLYDPDFTFATAKYADNGGAKTTEELKDYFAFYNFNRSEIDRFIVKKDTIKDKIRNRINDELVYKIKSLLRMKKY